MKPGRKWKAERQSPRSSAASALRRRRLDRPGIDAAAVPGSYQLPPANDLSAAQARADYASPVLEKLGSPAPDDAAREQRRQVLRRVRGMWKERGDAPRDGLRYQLESRAEWDR